MHAPHALQNLPIFWNWTQKNITDSFSKIEKSSKSLHPTLQEGVQALKEWIAKSPHLQHIKQGEFTLKIRNKNI